MLNSVAGSWHHLAPHELTSGARRENCCFLLGTVTLKILSTIPTYIKLLNSNSLAPIKALKATFNSHKEESAFQPMVKHHSAAAQKAQDADLERKPLGFLKQRQQVSRPGALFTETAPTNCSTSAPNPIRKNSTCSCLRPPHPRSTCSLVHLYKVGS